MPARPAPSTCALGTLALLALATFPGPAFAAEPAGRPEALQQVARFEHQVTGVAVTETGRIFVNFPRWTEDVPLSVAELKGGAVQPYPNEEWNRWRNAAPLSPGEHFVCVQSVFADGHGSLWVLDPAAPNTEHIVQGGPKLVQIDLASNAVKRVVGFDPSAAPEGSYLNDIRLSPDGHFGFITDSGATGALVVVDLTSGKSRRVLDGDASTQVEPGVQIVVDGHELRRPDGRPANMAADSIALDAAGQQLYWKALTGRTLYRIATAALTDASIAPEQLAGRVEKVAELEPTDGFWMDAGANLFLTAIQENAVKRRAADGRIETIAQDKRLRWPDTFAQGADATLYVTASHIQDSPWFHDKGWTDRDFTLWKLPGELAVSGGSQR